MDWQARLPGSVPVICRRMHRVFWVPKRYVSLVAIGLSGPFTIREAAARSGYSLKGAWSAARSLESMGIARFDSTRGRSGRTRMRLSSDAQVNVSSTVTSRDIQRESDVDEQETFSLAAYKADVEHRLKARLGLA